jgi:hypothetical protein
MIFRVVCAAYSKPLISRDRQYSLVPLPYLRESQGLGDVIAYTNARSPWRAPLAWSPAANAMKCAPERLRPSVELESEKTQAMKHSIISVCFGF